MRQREINDVIYNICFKQGKKTIFHASYPQKNNQQIKTQIPIFSQNKNRNARKMGVCVFIMAALLISL